MSGESRSWDAGQAPASWHSALCPFLLRLCSCPSRPSWLSRCSPPTALQPSLSSTPRAHGDRTAQRVQQSASLTQYLFPPTSHQVLKGPALLWQLLESPRACNPKTARVEGTAKAPAGSGATCKNMETSKSAGHGGPVARNKRAHLRPEPVLTGARPASPERSPIRRPPTAPGWQKRATDAEPENSQRSAQTGRKRMPYPPDRDGDGDGDGTTAPSTPSFAGV